MDTPLSQKTLQDVIHGQILEGKPGAAKRGFAPGRSSRLKFPLVARMSWRGLPPGQYLIHDRDGKYCPAFQQIIDDAGVKRVPLPARSPNLNAFADRWVRSVKEECLSRLILFGESSLRRAVTAYVEHYHGERNHQGKENVLLFPAAEQRVGCRDGKVRCKERLGGLLKYYHRQAA